MTFQPRKPAGSPDGGQFAATSRASSGLDLSCSDDDGLNASYSNVSVDELNDLSSPHRPLSQRASVARTPYPGVAERCSRDPDPRIRALAASGWDLTDATRASLTADVQVQDLLKAL